MDMSKLNALSDDMIGQLYLNTKRILMERGVSLADLTRSQIRIGNIVTFPDKSNNILTAVVKGISNKTVSVNVVNPLNHDLEILGQKWRVGFDCLTLVEKISSTNLQKAIRPVETHKIQTQGGDW